MGNRGKRSEIEKHLKDRGDSPQKLYLREKDNMGINRTVSLRRHLPDCGDNKGKKMKIESSDEKQRAISPRLNVTIQSGCVSQATNTPDVITLRNKPDESTSDEQSDYRTRIRDHYTKLSKDSGKLSRSTLPVKEVKSRDVLKIVQSSDKMPTPDKSKVPSVTKSYDSIKIPKRKPIIKTITSKKGAVHKAVTFTDTPQLNPLQIKVPRAPTKKVDYNSRIPKRVKTINNHQIEREPKPKKKGTKGKPAKMVVREPLKTAPLISAAKILSPPTEVAKWSPSQNSTMPYYEAWVDTTLAAISNYSTRDKLYFERQNIMQMCKTEQDYRPESYYPLDDERYTGKITVKQR